ncbi:hypothetical protein Tsp_03416 [Trichinella spiralis]|uniref:hypothetical protein n=1 Tax=Trichinella spiralis TaxID=6334 RepID=UPI0001EFCDC2|nr:hypothetical protein Tsp_03416 [Trichinella spiralis]
MNAELGEIEMRPLQLMHRSENDPGIEYSIGTCSISENRKVEKCESDFPTFCFLAIPLLVLNVAVVLILVMLSDTNFDFGVNLPTELELVEQKSLNPYMNLTARGYFHLRDHNNKVLQKLQSSWLQDDLNKRLKITIGQINSKSWLCDYYFFENETFIVLPSENESTPPSAVCNHVPNWGYENEMERYRTSASYAGRRFFKENGNTTRLVHVVVSKLNRTNGVEIAERIIDADSMNFCMYVVVYVICYVVFRKAFCSLDSDVYRCSRHFMRTWIIGMAMSSVERCLRITIFACLRSA